MGFNFLKKKNKETEAVPPLPEAATNMDSISDIPLPPPKNDSISEPASLDNNSEGINDAPLPSIDTAPKEDFNIEEPITNISNSNVPIPNAEENVPLSREREVEDLFKQPEDNISEEEDFKPLKDEELDFSLPDFSDEELNIKELEKGNDETKPFDEPQETPKTEVSAFEPDVLEEKEEVESISSVPRELPEQVGSNKFIELKSCKNIYADILEIKEQIEISQKTGQKLDSLQKNVLQSHQILHDDLDIIQEKLMDIDRTLFER